MSRHDHGPTRLYVGRLSTRTRSRDLEHLFSKYGRIREVDVKHDFAFIEFNHHRDADDARHYLDGEKFDGNRIVVEFARKDSRRGAREFVSRSPLPGTDRCYNCGNDGHWARDCKAADQRDKCYSCGKRGHIARNCQSSQSPDRLPRRRSRSRSLSSSRSYSGGSPAREANKQHRRSGSHSLTPNPVLKKSKSRSASPNASEDVSAEGTLSPRSSDAQNGGS